MTPPLSADLEEERGIRSFIAEIVNVKNVPVVLPIIKILSSVPCHLLDIMGNRRSSEIPY
jgi:hypothetical protein